MAFLKELYKNNNFILLKKYEGEDIQADNDTQLEELDKNSDKIRICVIDLETTGLSHDDDEIIELAIKLIEVDKKSIIAGKNNVDITNIVIEELNKALPSINLK